MKAYDELKVKMAELFDLRGAVSVMVWDQEVMMPDGGGQMRARQTATLNGLIHEKFVNEAGKLIDQLDPDKGEWDEISRNNILQLKKELTEKQKLPTAFVQKLSQTIGEAFPSWRAAKTENDFSKFADSLKKLVELKQQEAEYLGYEEKPYDALLDTYEHGMTTRKLDDMFMPFKVELGELLKEISDRPQVEDQFLKVRIPDDVQLEYGKDLLESIGYDFNSGRLDLSAHPFMISMNPQDVRVTTMVYPSDITMMMYSTLHEGGHALYELGMNHAHYGMPAGEPCSLSIHESQSRFWENNVSREASFLAFQSKEFRNLFPDRLQQHSDEAIFRAINKVQPSLIRIAADELTYHFHIVLRYELEAAMINGDLAVEDLPAAWNERVQSYLGLEVPSDREGCLQDIHWSHGSFGYFPTYSLGSFYAAQFMAAARKAHPDLNEKMARGDFSPIHHWLSENIYKWGRQFDAEELCEKATGEKLNVNYFITYAREKFGTVYGL